MPITNFTGCAFTHSELIWTSAQARSLEWGNMLRRRSCFQLFFISPSSYRVSSLSLLCSCHEKRPLKLDKLVIMSPSAITDHYTTWYAQWYLAGHTGCGKSGSQNETMSLNAWELHVIYLIQILIGQEMQLPGFEAVLTFTFVENVGLEFPTWVFFCRRHCISFLFTVKSNLFFQNLTILSR